MGVMVYKEGEKPLRIEPWEMDGYLTVGWSLDENAKPQAAPQSGIEQARIDYEAKFGKKPHHKMKLETILEELNGNDSL